MRKVLGTDNMTLGQKKFDLPKMAELIDAAYRADTREISDRAKKSFSPSNIGYGSGTCARRWFYDFNGGWTRAEEVDAVSIANMSYGTEAHARLQKVFESTGILVEAERKVINSEPPIFGFADLVINWQGEEAVGEIKTTMQESFVSKKAKNNGAGYHLLQVLIYMKVLGLNKGFLLYENKNLQTLLLIPVFWNEANKKLIDDTFEWMTAVHENWKSGQLPTRPFTQKSVQCKSCVFKEHCWKDEAGVVTLPPLSVPK